MTIYPVARNPITRQAYAYIFNAGGVIISPGPAPDVLNLPWNSRLEEVRLAGGPVDGDITIDIWAAAAPDIPANDTFSIIGDGGTKPALENGRYASISDFSGWVTREFADDTNVVFNVDAADLLESVTVTLIVNRL